MLKISIMSFDCVLSALSNNIFSDRATTVIDHYIIMHGASLLDWVMQKKCSTKMDSYHLHFILEIIRRYDILQQSRYSYEDIMHKYHACMSFDCFHHYVGCNISKMYSIDKANIPSRETLIMLSLPPKDRKEYLCTDRQRYFRMIWTVEICVASPHLTKLIYDIFDHQTTRSIVFSVQYAKFCKWRLEDQHPNMIYWSRIMQIYSNGLSIAKFLIGSR